MNINDININNPVQEEVVQDSSVEIPVKKKRGRKPNPENSKNYFSEVEEAAVLRYCNSNDDIEKNRIYNQYLHAPFVKMVESLIKRYMLFVPGESFEDTRDETLAHLISKLHYYNPNNKTKAYSYYGTICKNHLIHERAKAQANIKKTLSYDVVYTDSNPDLRYDNPQEFDETNLNQKVIQTTIIEIEKMLVEPERFSLNENDVKVGYALLELLNNWEDIFQNLKSKKYNKNCVDSFIKEMTQLTTKPIRDAKKKYAVLYFKIKDKILSST